MKPAAARLAKARLTVVERFVTDAAVAARHVVGAGHGVTIQTIAASSEKTASMMHALNAACAICKLAMDHFSCYGGEGAAASMA
jgi:hypothetical protein